MGNIKDEFVEVKQLGITVPGRIIKGLQTIKEHLKLRNQSIVITHLVDQELKKIKK